MDPLQNQSAPMNQPVEKKSFGPLIGIIVIIAVIIIGGLYFWKNMLPSGAESTATSTPSSEVIDGIEASLNSDASITPADFSDIESQLK